MRTSIHADKLKALFRAFRERNDDAFVKVAERIIDEEVAANHHTSATELQQALGRVTATVRPAAKVTALSPLPLKDRRSGEDLLSLTEVSQAPALFLTPTTKQQITRIIQEQQRSQLLRDHGYAPKHKLLFWGPPGCGKTLTARYLAHELGLPLAVVRLDAVISSFLGDTASHLHRIIARADHQPMVLLLDEVDALAKHRDDPNDVGELKRVVNSLLQALDTFTGQRSLLIAASNHQYLLDPAVWRRFDAVVEFPCPGQVDRTTFLKYLLNGVRFTGSLSEIGKKTVDMAYSSIEQVVIEAIKTMLLSERTTLSSRDLAEEIQAWKKAQLRARSRRRKSTR